VLFRLAGTGPLLAHICLATWGGVTAVVTTEAEKRSTYCTNLHDHHGHQGVERTTTLVHKRCYWPFMRQDIERWCHECTRCLRAKAVQPKVKTFMGSLLASRPLEIVAIDFTMLERASDGRENLLVVTDVFSKFAQAYPTSDQRAVMVVRILTERWFYAFWCPKTDPLRSRTKF